MTTLRDPSAHDEFILMPLADFECPHGHLPSDVTFVCDCFSQVNDEDEKEEAE